MNSAATALPADQENQPPQPATAPSVLAAWVGRISTVVIIASILIIARSIPLAAALDRMEGWFHSLGPLGPAAYALLYAVAAVLLIPGSVLTLSAGAFFGVFWGTVAVSIGSTTAVAIAFLISRYLARDAVARRVEQYPKFAAIDAAISEGGWKIVAMLRLSPAVPFSLQNYLYGLTGIGFWPTVLTSWITMLPGTLMYVYLGYVSIQGLQAAAGGPSTLDVGRWVLLGVGLAATVAVTVYLTRLAQRKIAEQTEIIDANDDSQPDLPTGPVVTGWTSGTTRLAVIALLAAALAGCAVWKGDDLARLFGPPSVTLHEAYADAAPEASFDHGEFDALLHKYVDAGGWVDYAGLATDHARLDRYITTLADAPFDKLGRDDKLALLINAYNAFTLRLILDYWDGGKLASIQDIPAAKRWDAKRWKLAGDVVSLNQIEHERIRPKFKEPRIHFALVCAAIGCPPLRNEAYVGSQIDAQLDAQTRYVHEHKTWFAYDAAGRQLYLTKLYQWYGADFKQVAGSVFKFAARYNSALAGAIAQGKPPRIRWLDYDWKLNSKTNRRPR